MSPCRSPRTWRRMLALAWLVVQAAWMPAAPAQEEKPEPKREQPAREPEKKGEEPAREPEKKGEAPAPAEEKTRIDPQAARSNPGIVLKHLKEPTPWRVYQRDANNRADIPIVLDPSVEGVQVRHASLTSGPVGGQTQGVGRSGGFAIAAPFRDGKILGAPVNVPSYHVNITFDVGGTPINVFVGPVFVGDLWVLAGQSNMEGYANLEDVTPPSDRVALLGMDGKWSRAEEPLHWLVDSPDPVHSGDPATREQRAKEQHKSRRKGAGLGLPFAVALNAATDVPIGLVATAHGGTSMAQWEPAKKGEGGNSLYGSMLRQVERAGGRVRGVLWYQGESDANPEASKTYPRTMLNFIASVREDLHDPDLPFYLVQIGRFVIDAKPEGWNAIREAQRRIPDRVPATAVVASVDLELDDLIHVGTPGLKRLGGRLARIAERELFGQVGATTPTFERVNRRDDTTLVVRFKGVNRVAAASGPTPAMGRPGGGFAPTALSPMAGGAPPSAYGLPAPSGASPNAISPGQSLGGLQPARHIAGFSIRKEDGTPIPLIYDAAVGPSKDTVILRLVAKPPDGAALWYGYGLDPYCNLTDQLDMAVPAFGPIPLDDPD